MAHGKPSVIPLSCMSMVVEELEAWRTHGLVMAMCQTGLRVVSYTQNQLCSLEKREERKRKRERKERIKERKGEKERKKRRKGNERKRREIKEKIERKEKKGKEGELCRTSISKKRGVSLRSNR